MTIDIVAIIIIIRITIITMLISTLIIKIININFIHGCIITGVNNNIYIVVIMAEPFW